MARNRQSTEPRGVLVLGMHRSGTSATAGVLAALGFQLGERLIEGARDNPLGYFEHAGVVAIHERLLDALGRSWDDVRPLPAGWTDSDAAHAAVRELAALLRGELSGPTPWAVKDPRTCRLLPLWQRALGAAGTQAGGLFVLRHPDEVAASLQARDGLPAEASHLAWLRHMVEAEAATRGWRRTLLPYPRLLEAPGTAIAAALDALGIAAPRDAGAAEQGVDARARHHAAGDTPAEAGPWRALAVQAHAALEAAGTVDALGPFEAALELMARDNRHWIEAVGAVQASGHGRVVRWRDAATAAVARAEHLQGRLDESTELSLSRLGEIEALDGRMAAAARAQADAEALLEGVRAEVRRTGEALRRAEDLAASRLDEVREAIAAKDAAESLAQSRLDEVREAIAAKDAAELLAQSRLDEVRQALAAKDVAESLAQSRLDEARQALDAKGEAEAVVAALRDDVARVSDALVRTEHLANARLAEVAAADRRLRDAEAMVASLRDETARLDGQVRSERDARDGAEALLGEARRELARQRDATAAAEALAVARLDDIGQLDQRLRAMDEAKALAERLAYARAGAIAELEGAVAALRDELQSARARIEALEAALATVRASRWWRTGARLRLARDPADP